MTLDAPARSWSPDDEVELDVRDDLRAGREPFRRILAAVDALGPTQVLHLRAIFEPLPLHRVLAQRGFAAVSHAHAPDDWSVWFHRGAPHATGPTAAARRSAGPVGGDAPAAVTLDVRGLTPPEPLQRTLAALESLPEDATLVQLNDRVPQFLLPLLHERGFAFTVDSSRSDGVRVHIRRGR
jgi:uncharacterized protein (DUF2249 family)